MRFSISACLAFIMLFGSSVALAQNSQSSNESLSDREQRIFRSISEIDGTTLTMSEQTITQLRREVSFNELLRAQLTSKQTEALTEIAVIFAMMQAQPSTADWDSKLRSYGVATPNASRPVISESIARNHKNVRGSRLAKALPLGIVITTGTAAQVSSNVGAIDVAQLPGQQLPDSLVVIEVAAVTIEGTTTSLRRGLMETSSGWRLFPASGFFNSRLTSAK